MPIIIIFTAIISVLIAFVSETVSNYNAFFNFYILLGSFFINDFFYVLVGFIIACIIFLKRAKLNSDYSIKNKILISVYQVSASIFVGTFFAFVLLLIIACAELNILAVITDFSPSLLGINSNVDSIVSTIKTNNTVPQIIASDTDNYEELLGIATATTGTTNVYGKSILTSIPSLLVLPIIQPSSSMLLIDNTLIVTKINRKDLQKVSPVIGNLLVKEYFPTRKIKSYPLVKVMTSDEYKKVRGEEYGVKLAKIDDELQIISGDIASISADVQNDKNNIALNNANIDTASQNNSSQYSSCINSGEYKSGLYVHYNSKEYCDSLLRELQNSSQKSTDDLASQQKRLDFDMRELESYNYYQNFFNAQKQLMPIAKLNIPSELGLFVRPQLLEIVTTSSGTHIITNYFETLAHEYLHYASYSPGKDFTTSFFEEGLTEYFARQTIKDNFNADTNLGYPVYVKIITEMAKIIPESEFADIYFTKDEKRLEATIDRVYGDGFYKKNLITFESLQYSSDPNQTLKFANTIMKQIGGNPLTLKALQSSADGL